ncbi:MAG: hypothetical protein D6820_15005, partial [Lentisphaerae bacterium]
FPSRLNRTLSYGVTQIHRGHDWMVYFQGCSDLLYHTQYVREGTLFYNLCSLSLVYDGLPSPMQKKVHAKLIGRHSMNELMDGYLFSYAPAVTAIDAPYEKLSQRYYQRGSSPFAGGLSQTNGIGIFTLSFRGHDNPRQFSATPAAGLSFRKSFFALGNKIICLASSIENTGPQTPLHTGLWQEPWRKHKPGTLLLANGQKIPDGIHYDRQFSSQNLPWLRYRRNQREDIGIYLWPRQHVVIHCGEQQAGSRKGEFSTLWLHHPYTPTVWKRSAYAFMLIIQPHSDELETLNQQMRSPSPPYQILRLDDQAHILRDLRLRWTGYVFFQPPTSPLNSNTHLLKAVSSPCLVAIQQTEHHELRLAVTDPNLHMNRTATDPGWSRPSPIQLTLYGAWKMSEIHHEEAVPALPVRVLSRTATLTSVEITCRHGLTREFRLVPFAAQTNQ